MSAQPRMGTRWGRALFVMGAAFAALGSFTVLLVPSVFAGTNGSLRIQNVPMDFSSARIQATDVAFGVTPVTSVNANGTTTERAVLRSGFAVASLKGLCVSRTETVKLPLGGSVDVLFKLSVPDTHTVQARSASFDLTSLRGDGATGIQLRGSAQIGQATADLTTLPGVKPFEANPLGAPTVNNGYGWTGIDASSGDLHNVSGKLWQAQISGDIGLPKLSIKVHPSGTEAGC